MSRNTAFVIVLALLAGLMGGVAAREFSDSPPAAADDTPAPPTDLAKLADEVTSLRRAVVKLDQRVGQLTLDLAARTEQVDELKARFDADSDADPDADSRIAAAGGMPGRILGADGDPVVAVRSMSGGHLGELWRMKEEERWAKVRDDLSLDSYQESELQRIRDDLQTQMKDLFHRDPSTGQMAGKLDIGKLMEVRKETDERVKNLLSADQYEKWTKNGYGNALGLGGAGGFVTYSVGASRAPSDEEKDK